MPYKSQAQAGKFHEMLKRGEISAKVVKEFDTASKGLKLPKRVKPKKVISGRKISQHKMIALSKKKPKGKMKA